MIIAIDGPAGSGKSTIASELGRRLGFHKLDTGAMYRAVALAALTGNVRLDDEEALSALAEGIDLRFSTDAEGASRISLDGRDVSAAIRTPEVDEAVSKVSAVPGVRAAMLGQQRRAAEGMDLVAEGRDIGTVVFPDAEVKVFLTADDAERARRRVAQRHEGEQVDPSAFEREVEETLAALRERDRADSSRTAAPLVAAEDAVRIDSSTLSIEEVVQRIEGLVADRKGGR